MEKTFAYEKELIDKIVSATNCEKFFNKTSFPIYYIFIIYYFILKFIEPNQIFEVTIFILVMKFKFGKISKIFRRI